MIILNVFSSQTSHVSDGCQLYVIQIWPACPGSDLARTKHSSSDVTILHMSELGPRPITAPRSAGQMTWSRPHLLTHHLPSQHQCAVQKHTHANALNVQRYVVTTDKVTAGQMDCLELRAATSDGQPGWTDVVETMSQRLLITCQLLQILTSGKSSNVFFLFFIDKQK